MATKVIFNPEEKIMQGVNIVADAVEISLGAKGLFAGMSAANPKGKVYDRTINADGVSIANAIDLKDEEINFSAQILIEAAKKQRDMVGDGTTVTILLARAVMREAKPLIASGEHPQTLVPQLQEAVTKMLGEIKKQAKPTKKLEDLIQIASVSAKSDELGEIIGKTLHTVGIEAIVNAEPSKSVGTSVDHQKGMQFDQGYYHEFFTTNEAGDEAYLDDPYILVTDKPINSLRPLGAFLNTFITKAKKLVIISPDISRDALGLFLQNKMEGKMLPLCIKAPGMATNQKAILQDIAAFTGATYITEDANHEFENVKMEHLGRATSITCSVNETLITGGKGSKEAIKGRIESIKAQLTKDQTDFHQIKLRERLGRLTTGVAVIYVGGHTEIEMKERRERVIDGIAATQAAMKEGILPGGEIIYLKLRDILTGQNFGEKILIKALEQPFRRLLTNAGMDAGRALEKLDQPSWKITSKEAFGINVVTKDIENFWDTGIIDPAAISSNALQNALSVACKLLCTKVIIIPDNEAVSE